LSSLELFKRLLAFFILDRSRFLSDQLDRIANFRSLTSFGQIAQFNDCQYSVLPIKGNAHLRR